MLYTYFLVHLLIDDFHVPKTSECLVGLLGLAGRENACLTDGRNDFRSILAAAGAATSAAAAVTSAAAAAALTAVASSLLPLGLLLS